MYMTEFVRTRTAQMRCVKKGKHHAVFHNPKTGLYEIWDGVEQCDWFDSKTEAIEAMKDMDKHYMEDLY